MTLAKEVENIEKLCNKFEEMYIYELKDEINKRLESKEIEERVYLNQEFNKRKGDSYNYFFAIAHPNHSSYAGGEDIAIIFPFHFKKIAFYEKDKTDSLTNEVKEALEQKGYTTIREDGMRDYWGAQHKVDKILGKKLEELWEEYKIKLKEEKENVRTSTKSA